MSRPMFCSSALLSAGLLAVVLPVFAPHQAQAQAPVQAPPAAPPAATPQPIQGVGTFLTRQEPGQWRLEDLEEMQVYTPDGKGIGEIEDVLVDQSGRFVAVILEVGGFLGINEKRIAVPVSALEFQQPQANQAGRDGMRIVMRLGRAELEGAPAFKGIGER